MTPNDLERYSRQIRFGAIGEIGQERIRNARVAIVGCGALGSVQAEALARAGTGFLRIIDRDSVDLTNLQRQFLFDESYARDALPKAVAAARRLSAVASNVTVEPVVADLDARNVEDLLDGVGLVLDGTDNFETRYLINDFCVSRGIPWLYGGAVGSYGIKMAILPGAACFACVYPDPPAGVQPTCETAGVLGPVTLAVAAMQTGDALKILAGHSGEIARIITTIDVWSGTVRQIQLAAPDPACRACGRRDFVYLRGGRRTPISLCGRNSVQIHERNRPVDLAALARQLGPISGVRANEFALRAQVDNFELTVFPDGRAIIKGTTDPGVARGIYARYVGN